MMQTRTALAAAAAALIALGATAAAPAYAKSPAATGKNQCFFTRNVNGFAAPDEKTLYVRVGVRDVYQFEMFGRCPDIDWNQRLALVSRPSSSITQTAPMFRAAINSAASCTVAEDLVE